MRTTTTLHAFDLLAYLWDEMARVAGDLDMVVFYPPDTPIISTNVQSYSVDVQSQQTLSLSILGGLAEGTWPSGRLPNVPLV